MGFFSSLFKPKSEKRALKEADIWRSFGPKAASGVIVTPDTALRTTAVFACVRILAETLASLPLILYEKSADGGKKRAENHTIYPILHDQPNPEMTSFDFWETLMAHVVLRGNGYAEIDWSAGGQVLGLWPLHPDRTVPGRNSNRELVYTYYPSADNPQFSGPVTLKSWQVLHLRGLSSNGLYGYSPIDLAMQAVGLSAAAEEFGSRFFGNDARPGIVLKHPGELGDKAMGNLRKYWEEKHGSLSNAQRVGILEEGMDIKEIGLAPEHAQFLETRKFQVHEIARIFRIPPHMLADLERATFSNIEHQSIDFVVHTMRPWLVRFEKAIKKSLLTPTEKKKYYAEFLVDALLRGDTKSRYETYQIGINNGILSPNDARRRENMNPVTGGDTYLVPLNLAPIGSTPQQNSLRSKQVATTAGDEWRSTGDDRHQTMLAIRAAYQDVARRVLRREKQDITAAVKKYLSKDDQAAFLDWLMRFYADHKEFVISSYRPVMDSYSALVNLDIQRELGVEAKEVPLENFVTAYLEDFAERYAGQQEKLINSAIENSPGREAEAVTEEIDDWPEKRAIETANDESTRGGNALAKAIYFAYGIRRLRWVSFGDTCPYCKALNGTVVGINQWFLGEGTDFKPEGANSALTTTQNIGHPPAHRGCDCVVIGA